MLIKQVATICTLALLGSSCGAGWPGAVPLTDPKAANFDLQDLLGRGRQAPSLELGPEGLQSALSLLGTSTSGTLKKVQWQVGNDLPLWTAFDTRLAMSLPSTDLEVALAQLIVEYSDLLGIDLAQLGKPSFKVVGTRMHVLYPRMEADLSVRDAFLELILVRSKVGGEVPNPNTGTYWHLAEIYNKTYPHLALGTSRPPLGKKDGALSSHLSGKGLQLLSSRNLYTIQNAAAKFSSGILPNQSRPQGPVIVLSEESEWLHPVTGEIFTITSRVDDGSPIEAYSNRHNANVLLTGQVFSRTYLDGSLTPKLLALTPITDGDGVEFVSNHDGEIEAGAQQVTEVQLAGARYRVHNQRNPQPLKLTVEDNEGKLSVAPENLPALNTYAALNEINRFVRRQVSGGELPFLNEQMVAKVNVNGTCNAFYESSGPSINMFEAGDGCANTGLVGDVIYHEWGHALDFATGQRGGIRDGAFSEGIGDIVAGYFTDSPNMAPGFQLGSQDGIRRLDNEQVYPEDRGAVHYEGLIIGGAFWDMRESLKERYGNRAGAQKAADLFFRHLLTTDTYLDSYQAVLRLDDHDNNPATKSPNHCLINDAFARHGLANSENCTDQWEPPSWQRLDDLFLGFEDIDGDTVPELLLSFPKPKTFFGCLGDRVECFEEQRRDISFVVEGTKGDLILSMARLLEQAETLDELVIFGLGDREEIDSYRIVRFVGK